MRPQQLETALSELQAAHRLRRRVALQTAQGPHIRIDDKEYLAFASNDYLGLANHPALREAMQQAIADWGVGAGASALVAGHFDIQQQAEDALADFVGCEAALLFGSGFAANLGVISSLMGRGDSIFADRLCHASLNDGCVLSRAALKRFRHNDLLHLESLLAADEGRTRMMVVDAVYSMDGDEAPLPALLQLAERYDAWLLIDDAHGFGILGQGHGALAEFALRQPRVVYMGTLGKAAGVAGAFVAGTRLLIDWLVNSARSYIYTTAHPPAQAAAILAALPIIRNEKWRRNLIEDHIYRLRTILSDSACSLITSRTPIQAIIIGDNEATVRVAGALRDEGIWVPAIRPPTVPAGTARLRVSLSAAHSEQDMDRLLEALPRLLR